MPCSGFFKALYYQFRDAAVGAYSIISVRCLRLRPVLLISDNVDLTWDNSKHAARRGKITVTISSASRHAIEDRVRSRWVSLSP